MLVRVKNEVGALPAFWERLNAQSCIATTEVIFLDSGSTDGTVEYLKAVQCCLYTIAPEDFSFGSSCNTMMSLSTAPIAVFLSGHVLLKNPGDLEFVRNSLKSCERGAAYMRQVPNSYFGSTLYERIFLSRRFPAGRESGQIISLDNPGSFSNAASALTRTAWLATRFPEIHGSEDFLWAQMHIKAGGSLFYFPNIEVMHSHNETPDAVYKRVRLNVEARGQQRSYWQAAYRLCGVFIQMLRHGASAGEAWSYARQHAKAYL